MQITTSILVSYAYGLLAPHISQQVKEALLTDETLRWQYDGILQLMKDYPDDDPEELIEKMSANVNSRIHSTPEKKRVKQPSPFRNWLLLAAVFIVVIATGIFFFGRNNGAASELARQIIKENAANPFDNTTRGSLPVTDTTKWKTAFTNNRFYEVISLLEQKENKNPEEQFFLALSYLKSSPALPEKAKPVLIDLTKPGNNFTNDAWLYLGLTQTLLDQYEPALASLQHVEQTNQVKELKERLRK